MKPLPHRYRIKAAGDSEQALDIYGDQLPTLQSAAPADFGGPGDLWSPEDLLMAAVASCFILSFRAIAKASKFEWRTLECDAEGILNKVDKTIAFTEITTAATLTINRQEDIQKAEKLLAKAEQHCLVVNSLSAKCHLTLIVKLTDDALQHSA